MELSDYAIGDPVLFRQGAGWQKGEVLRTSKEHLVIKWQQGSNQKFTTTYDNRNVKPTGTTTGSKQGGSDQADSPLPGSKGKQQGFWPGL
jgi:hypothetical protein